MGIGETILAIIVVLCVTMIALYYIFEKYGDKK